MAFKSSGGNSQGNNNLLIIAGVLGVLLFLLVYLGSDQNSGIGQLISGASPDSSLYPADSGQDQIVEEKTPEETDKEEKPSPPDSLTNKTDSPDPKDSLANSEETKETSPPPPSPAEAPTSGGSIYSYTIKKGDTFYKIAAKFGNNAEEMQSLNKMEDMNLRAGDDLKVRIKAMHQVAQGEGLKSIAEKYGVSAKSIKAANGLDSDKVSSGSSLVIPLK